MGADPRAPAQGNGAPRDGHLRSGLVRSGLVRSGLVRVDKPEGPTSHDVVAMARRALGTRRIGHTGTLDPFASGLLLLCIGSSTRLAPYLSDLPKEYVARARLGIRTTTDDREGEVTATTPIDGVTETLIEEALSRFQGEIDQTPPAFSAKKIGGDRAYALARQGQAVSLASARVTVHELSMRSVELPFVEFDLRCSTGTYVRALARDMGEALGVGAHLVELRRTAIGPFLADEAVSLDELDDSEAVARARLSPVQAVGHMDRAELRSGAVEAKLRMGQTIALDEVVMGEETGTLALTLDGALVAIGERVGDRIHPRKVFVDE